MEALVDNIIKPLYTWITTNVAMCIAKYICDKILSAIKWISRKVKELLSGIENADEHDRQIVGEAIGDACTNFKQTVKNRISGKLHDKELERKLNEKVDITTEQLPALASAA